MTKEEKLDLIIELVKEGIHLREDSFNRKPYRYSELFNKIKDMLKDD